MNTGKTKVLIVDDSKLIRDLLRTILSADARIDVVGEAENPLEAREKIKLLNPDVLTLDVEMPKMNGIDFLKNLMRLRPMPVVMISTLTAEGSDITLQALELGAVDFLAKPANISAILSEYRDIVVEKVLMAAAVPQSQLLRYQNKLKQLHANKQQNQTPVMLKAEAKGKFPNKLLAIGGSTGSLEALREMMMACHFTGTESIVVCLHLPGSFTKSFANRLDKVLPHKVKEAEDLERIQPGHLYIGPGDYHIKVKKRAIGYQILLEDGEKVNRHKPSVEVLFNSVAEQAKEQAMAIMLTGMGKDGAKGMLNMHYSGAFTLAQDEQSSVVWGMPGASVEIGAVQKIDDLAGLAASIDKYFQDESPL